MLENSEAESRAILLQTSVEILETVFQLGRFRDKARYLIQDISDLVCDTSTRLDIRLAYLTNIDHSVRFTKRLCSDCSATR
jgi:broad-specificity NMP kinase